MIYHYHMHRHGGRTLNIFFKNNNFLLSYKELLLETIINNGYNNVSKVIPNTDIIELHHFEDIFSLIPNNNRYMYGDCISALDFNDDDVFLFTIKTPEKIIYKNIILKELYSYNEVNGKTFEEKVKFVIDDTIKYIEKRYDNFEEKSFYNHKPYENIMPFTHYIFLYRNFKRLPKTYIGIFDEYSKYLDFISEKFKFKNIEHPWIHSETKKPTVYDNDKLEYIKENIYKNDIFKKQLDIYNFLKENKGW